MEQETFDKECSICGYHIYQTIWAATIGEELLCEREPHNASDRYAVAVVKDTAVVGHLPRNISRAARCSIYEVEVFGVEFVDTESTQRTYHKEEWRSPACCYARPKEIKKLLKFSSSSLFPMCNNE